MTREFDNSDDAEIKIYQNVWKNIGLGIASLVFGLIGYFILFHNDEGNIKIEIAGWVGIIFFGGGGLTVIAINIYNKIRHIPLLIIGTDRLEMYAHFKGEYDIVDFSEIDGFRYIKFGKSRMIAIDFEKEAMENRLKDSSKMMRKMMGINLDYTGAAMNIPADNLTLKGEDIYNILNSRLESYKSLDY